MTQNPTFVQCTIKYAKEHHLKHIIVNRECGDCGDCRRVKFLGNFICYGCDCALPKGETLSHIKTSENKRNAKIKKKMNNNWLPTVYNGYSTKQR